MSIVSVLHQTARNYGEAGIKVFPCIPRTKIPATPNGHLDASADLGLIDHWWRENPSYNLAMCPADAGWAVVDQEAGADPAWANGHELPDTYMVASPRDGVHRFYEGTCPSSIQRLAPKVDVKSERGYVLLPPSVFFDEKTGKTGTYRVLKDVDMAPLPDWIPEALAKKSEKEVAPAGVKLDDPGNVMRAIKFLKTHKPVVEGEGSDDATFKVVAVMRDLGLSPTKAIEVLMDHYRCEPKDRAWIELKVANGYKYAENGPGAYAEPPMAEAFKNVLAQLPKEQPKDRGKFYFEDDDEMDLAIEPNWIIKDLIPENSIVLLTARKGSFKTFLALDICLGIATGKETFGTIPTVTGPTFYGAHEGIHHIKKAHRRAWRLAKGIEGKTEFYVARGPRIGIPEERDEFAKAIIDRCGKRNPRLIVLDTYSACMLGLDENSPGDANSFIAYCRDLIERFPGCSVLVPAHFGKDEGRGTRGTNALEAGIDTVLECRRTENTRLVSVTVKFQRGAPEREMPWHFEGQGIAGSLVFQPVAPADFAKASSKASVTSENSVIEALIRLRARGKSAAVSTFTLAKELVPMEPSETTDTWLARIKPIEKALDKHSTRRLEGCCERDGRAVAWFLPPTV